MFKIEPAVKRKSKLRLALTGITYSGKTYSALMLAHAMSDKVFVIDTESGSASLYADDFPPYQVLELTPPYSPDRYVEAIKALENAGAEVIIIDSLSHGWAGAGGCLSMVDTIANSSSAKNSYTAWGKVTPKQDALIHAIMTSKAHVITTMRSKMKYETVTDNGKTKPVKIGVGPVQRENIEYEFTTVLDLDVNHHYTCTKDRSGLFNNSDMPEPLTADMGAKLIDWLNKGADAKPVIEQALQNTTAPHVLTEAEQLLKKASVEFIGKAKVIKEKALKAQELGDQQLIELLIIDWYSICNAYSMNHDGFVVRQDVAEGIHDLLGLQKPVMIKGREIVYPDNVVRFVDEELANYQQALNQKKGEIKNAEVVNETKEAVGC